MSTEDIRDVKAVMFDFYGTVVDMQGSLTRAITPYLDRKGYTENLPGRLVTWWRRTHFENSMIDALLHRDHTPYRQIGFEAVDYTLDRAGIEHTDDEVRDLVSEITRLDPFPDVVQALADMKSHGLKLYILSNGDPDMLAAGVRSREPSTCGTASSRWRRLTPSSRTRRPTRRLRRSSASVAARSSSWPTTRSTASARRRLACVLPSSTAGRGLSANGRYPADVTVSDMAELAGLLRAR